MRSSVQGERVIMTNCRGERYQGGRMLGVRLCCAVKEDEKKKLLFERKGG
jgi:hypothetical protein